MPACPFRQPYMVFLFVGSSGLTEASFPRNLAIPQLLLSSAWGTPPRYERPDDRVPAQGTFTPSVHAHVRRTPGAAPNGGPTTPVGNSRASEGPPSVIRIVSCDMKLQSVLLGWTRVLTKSCVSPQVFHGSRRLTGDGREAVTVRGLKPSR